MALELNDTLLVMAQALQTLVLCCEVSSRVEHVSHQALAISDVKALHSPLSGYVLYSSAFAVHTHHAQSSSVDYVRPSYQPNDFLERYDYQHWSP
jgi:hypothetical protein